MYIVDKTNKYSLCVHIYNWKEIKRKVDFFLNNKGSHSVDYFHKKLGLIMWNKVGINNKEKS